MGLAKGSRIKGRRNRILETKGEIELQDWQKEILSMEKYDDILNDMFRDSWEEPKEDEIPLTQSQANMLEKVLGDEFFITDSKVRDILEAVFECGFYYERDRAVLNLARDCYLKGKNWIKKNG